MRVARSFFIVGGSILALNAAAFAATPPKNVILFIGDGLGAEQIKASGYYFNGAAGQFNFEQFPNFAWMTHNNSAGAVTDSAASGTALATGFKVDNEVISVALASGADPRRATPSDGRDLLTLLEQFKSAGKSTGLVTTSSMTDATPAAFAAHNPSRADSAGIASDYFTSTRPNVLFGGGAAGFDSAAASGAGYSVVSNRTQLQSLNTATTTNAAGIFGSGQFGYAYDQSAGTSTFYNANPFLQEMTSTALDILKKDNDGFFLMVENELTDSSAHLALSGANKVERNIYEVRELSRAVQKAIDFAATNPDTLILLTADHETGAFTANQNNGVGVMPSVTSGSTGHTAAWVPVYAMGPNAGHATGILDNTSIVNLATTSAAAPAPAVRKTFRQGDNGYAAAHDTHVRADSGGSAFGSTATLVVDQDDNAATGNQPVQSVVRFDSLIGAAGIPDGAQIRSARLTMHTGTASNDGTGATLEAHRLIVGFDDATTTWNNAGNIANNGFSLNNAGTADDDYLAAPESLFPDPSNNSLVSFDVTATMIAWMDNPSANQGWLLLSSGTDGWRWDSTESTGGFRPLLEVTYVAVPEPATCGFASLIAAAPLLRRRQRRVRASTQH
jgi:alkaline phosphatase